MSVLRAIFIRLAARKLVGQFVGLETRDAMRPAELLGVGLLGLTYRGPQGNTTWQPFDGLLSITAGPGCAKSFQMSVDDLERLRAKVEGEYATCPAIGQDEMREMLAEWEGEP